MKFGSGRCSNFFLIILATIKMVDQNIFSIMGLPNKRPELQYLMLVATLGYPPYVMSYPGLPTWCRELPSQHRGMLHVGQEARLGFKQTTHTLQIKDQLNSCCLYFYYFCQKWKCFMIELFKNLDSLVFLRGFGVTRKWIVQEFDPLPNKTWG